MPHLVRGVGASGSGGMDLAEVNSGERRGGSGELRAPREARIRSAGDAGATSPARRRPPAAGNIGARPGEGREAPGGSAPARARLRRRLGGGGRRRSEEEAGRAGGGAEDIRSLGRIPY